jgi:uncharacterized membrane protein YhaH (DUF805 family)
MRQQKGVEMNFNFNEFYFSAKARVNRQQWWLRLVLPLYLIFSVLVLVDIRAGTFYPEIGMGLWTGTFGLIVLFPASMVHIKRFHDRDKSGWWLLIALIPLIGPIWLLIELGFLKGTPGANQYGPPVSDLADSAIANRPG